MKYTQNLIKCAFYTIMLVTKLFGIFIFKICSIGEFWTINENSYTYFANATGKYYVLLHFSD